MFSHIFVGTRDVERAKRFYDAALAVLGAPPGTIGQAKTGHRRVYYRHDGATFCAGEPIDGQPATVANGGTIGFRCASPEMVDAFHAAAVAHGGVPIEDPPGWREGSFGKLYLAYMRDPDGHKLCALYRPVA